MSNFSVHFHAAASPLPLTNGAVAPALINRRGIPPLNKVMEISALFSLLTTFLDFPSVLSFCKVNRMTRKQNQPMGARSLPMTVSNLMCKYMTNGNCIKLQRFEKDFPPHFAENSLFLKIQSFCCEGWVAPSTATIIQLMPNLTQLGLNKHYDDLTDGLPALSQLTNLQILSLGDGNDDHLVHISGLTRLHALDFKSNNMFNFISQIGLQHISGLSNLERLNLYKCGRITDLDFLSGLSHLQELCLAYCSSLTNDALQHLSSLTAIRSLDLSGCGDITEVGLQHLSNLTSMNDLNISQCSTSTLQGLGVYVNLKTLNLLGCKTTDIGLENLSTLMKLSKLNLCCNQITDIGLQSLSPLTFIQSLYLSHCDLIKGVGLTNLSTLTLLTTLDLGNSGVTDAGLLALRQLTTLQRLDLKGCKKITDEGLINLNYLNNLTLLYLQECHSTTKSGRQKLYRSFPQCTHTETYESPLYITDWKRPD